MAQVPRATLPLNVNQRTVLLLWVSRDQEADRESAEDGVGGVVRSVAHGRQGVGDHGGGQGVQQPPDTAAETRAGRPGPACRRCSNLQPLHGHRL